MTVTVCPVIKNGRYSGLYEVTQSANTFGKKRNDIDPKVGTRGSLDMLEKDYPKSIIIVDESVARDYSTGQKIKTGEKP